MQLERDARAASKRPLRSYPRRPLSGLLAALIVVACATATHRPAGSRGEPGCQDEWIGPDRFEIVATGDRATPIDGVCEVAMLRAAHIAIEHGRDNFVVRDKVAALADVGLSSLDWFMVFLPGVGPVPVVTGTRPDPRPVCTLSIQLCRGWEAPPATAVDAHRVVEQLGGKPER